MIPKITALKDKFSKEHVSLGLDIGSASLKLVELRFLGDEISLSGFKIEAVKSENELTQAIRTITRSPAVRNINISLSGPSTIIRYVNFPRMNSEELKEALKFEAPKHITFPINEAVIDGCILRQDLADNKMLVLLAATKKEAVNQWIKLIHEAGLKVNLVDIDSIALVNAFIFNHKGPEDALGNKTVALINMGASTTNINILENASAVLSRDIYTGGNKISQKIGEVLNVDFKSAEAWKLDPDKQRLESVTAGIKPLLSELCAEIRTSFDYYESQGAYSVGKIFLSGGGSRLFGLKDALAGLLGVEVDLWDPLKQIKIPDNIDSQNARSLSNQLAVAVGLALRR